MAGKPFLPDRTVWPVDLVSSRNLKCLLQSIIVRAFREGDPIRMFRQELGTSYDSLPAFCSDAFVNSFMRSYSC